MSKKNASILFLGKADDAYVEKALRFCESNFSDVSAHLGIWGERLPESAASWEGDYIISYLSRWVVPGFLLEKAKIAAFNFHPASPAYPGIGCNNFALYEDAKEYGVTCHHMAAKVDTGILIAVKRFPVFSTDNVSSILERTYEHQIVLFYEVLGMILNDQPLPELEETWTRKPFSRKEFNQLRQITPDMTKEEIARRIRATAYGEWQPWVEIEGYVFSMKPKDEE
jgi:methionyl-tRNA formyltransferase